MRESGELSSLPFRVSRQGRTPEVYLPHRREYELRHSLLFLIISLNANVASEDEKDVHISNKDKCSSQLFTDYYKSEYGCAPSEELLGLFLSLTETEEE